MVAPTKMMYAMASKTYDPKEGKSLDEEISYLDKYMRGSLPPYQRKSRNHGLMEPDCYREWREKDRRYDRYVPSHDRSKNKDVNHVDPDKNKTEDVMARILMKLGGTNKMVCELKVYFL